MENQSTGGAATIGRRNAIQTARLKPLRSHGQLAQEAAAACTAGWPDATSWEAQAITEGRWISASPTSGRGDAEESLEIRWDMAQQEIARLVREELTALIQPVQLVSVQTNRTTGEVSGVFRSNGMPFNYSIKDEVVRYGPVGTTTDRSDAEEVEGWTGERMDAGKPRNCTKGFACGSTCITKGKICKAKGGRGAQQLSQAVRTGNQGPSSRYVAGERKLQRALEDLELANTELAGLKGAKGAAAAKKRREARALAETAKFTINATEADLVKRRGRRDSADWSTAPAAGYREVMGFRADGDLEELQQQNEQAAAIEREAWLELDTSKRLRRSMRMREEADAYLAEINEDDDRADARMDGGDRVTPVAIKASAVLQSLAQINERLPGMSGPMQVLAEKARATALQALQSAGIDPTTSWAEAV